MMKQFVSVFSLAVGSIVLTAAPALAIGDDIVVPEPSTLSILGGAVVAGLVANRLRKRK